MQSGCWHQDFSLHWVCDMPCGPRGKEGHATWTCAPRGKCPLTGVPTSPGPGCQKGPSFRPTPRHTSPRHISLQVLGPLVLAVRATTNGRMHRNQDAVAPKPEPTPERRHSNSSRRAEVLAQASSKSRPPLPPPILVFSSLRAGEATRQALHTSTLAQAQAQDSGAGGFDDESRGGPASSGGGWFCWACSATFPRKQHVYTRPSVLTQLAATKRCRNQAQFVPDQSMPNAAVAVIPAAQQYTHVHKRRSIPPFFSRTLQTASMSHETTSIHKGTGRKYKRLTAVVHCSPLTYIVPIVLYCMYLGR